MQAPRDRGIPLASLPPHVPIPHLFLSHSSADGAWVARLAEDLNLCGVDVWLDTWELRVGDDLHERITEAVEKSRFVGVVITKHFNAGQWVKGEVHQALSREKAEKRTIVLPLLADNVEPPPVLASKKFLDFAASYYKSLLRLVGLVRNLDTYSLESCLSNHEPSNVADCRELLWRECNYSPVGVVGTKMLDEIMKAGGVRDGEVVRFHTRTILSAQNISRSLRALMERIRKTK